MRKQGVAIALAGAVALALGGSIAWAQGLVSVNVPFTFVVSGEEMAAGRYEIQFEGDSRLAIRNTGNGHKVYALVMERLADLGAKEPKVVFDKTEDGKHYLSEIHVPGKDGFLVGIAGGKETHVTLPASE
jgi:hypothetical protein